MRDERWRDTAATAAAAAAADSSDAGVAGWIEREAKSIADGWHLACNRKLACL